MRIVFNSDVLFATQLIKDVLNRKVVEFMQECARHGHSVVIPSTVLYEFQFKQQGYRAAEINKLKIAKASLESWGIAVSGLDFELLVSEPDLCELIKHCGLKVEVVSPTMANYENAHRRACFHIPPAVPGAKSDEMRDLLIWEMALDVSKQDGQAMLIAQDKVLCGPGGDEEAKQYNLLRAESLDNALDVLNLSSISSQKILKLLEQVPVIKQPKKLGGFGDYQLCSIRDVYFVNQKNGCTKASAEGTYASGKNRFRVKIELEFQGQDLLWVMYSPIESDFKVERVLIADPVMDSDKVLELNNALRDILKEE